MSPVQPQPPPPASCAPWAPSPASSPSTAARGPPPLTGRGGLSSSRPLSLPASRRQVLCSSPEGGAGCQPAGQSLRERGLFPPGLSPTEASAPPGCSLADPSSGCRTAKGRGTRGARVEGRPSNSQLGVQGPAPRSGPHGARAAVRLLGVDVGGSLAGGSSGTEQPRGAPSSRGSGDGAETCPHRRGSPRPRTWRSEATRPQIGLSDVAAGVRGHVNKG